MRMRQGRVTHLQRCIVDTEELFNGEWRNTEGNCRIYSSYVGVDM